MRKASLRVVALVVAIVAIFSSTSLPARPIEVRLDCEGVSASPGKPFVCRLLIVNPKEGSPLVIPKLLLPGRFSFRPQTLVTFDATRDGSAMKLQVAKPAQSGRYDVATLSAEDLFILQPGRVYGWQYDLNGDDWVLPETPGRYQISANLDVRLSQRNKEGKLDPGVKEFLERYPQSTAGNLMNGQWSTKPIMVSVLALPNQDKVSPEPSAGRAERWGPTVNKGSAKPPSEPPARSGAGMPRPEDVTLQEEGQAALRSFREKGSQRGREYLYYSRPGKNHDNYWNFVVILDSRGSRVAEIFCEFYTD